ncbi:tumor necrosis factor receptor superfamily member 1A isoform 2-T2 [Leptodactylus fuscus]|uniref:tumor necrosis factor receptor superfamily member 1A isoform X2 n=1 Tax=Leptodactylus fuscus TaxID=238119 RepID=UPI003F4F3E2A
MSGTSPTRTWQSYRVNGSCQDITLDPFTAGFRVETDCSKAGMKTTCKPCDVGFYQKSPSNLKTCSECSDCLSQFGQIVVRPCTSKNDTVCGCPAGQYKFGKERKFTCLNCSRCDNGTEHYPCTADRNTVCKCNIDFYLDSEDQCRSCDECDKGDDCVKQCPVKVVKLEETNPIVPVLAGTMGIIILALVGVILVKHRQKLISAFKKSGPKKGPLAAPTVPESGPLSTPLMESSMSPGKLDTLPGHMGHTVYIVEDVTTQQNRAQNSPLPLPDIMLQTNTPSLNSTEVLYKIIECIPVERWKEFIRRLGVIEHVIDTCIHDNKHYYKEAQYAMLSFWVDNGVSSGHVKDSLFKVLREMNLGGCVERIEDYLRPKTLAQA